jgi:glycosyltransferase involved in cell wall biosynthesis
MKICQVHPACGIDVPPKDWGAIEKIVWELHLNFLAQGHESEIKFATEINPGDFDIVHCHVGNLALMLQERGISYIFQLHDHHAYHYGKDSYVFKENMRAIEGSIMTLVPARYLVDYFDHPKVQYFAHGVNTKEFYPIDKPKPTEPKLLMIANNGLAGNPGFDRKGFTYGIALAQSRNLPITVAGPSNNKHFFNNHLWTLAYPKLNIIFDLPNNKLLDLYHQHDIFVHPTMLEAGHPNLTMIEAAATGLPVIADWESETDFHGGWRAPRDVFEMTKGLDDIMSNWDSYRQRCLHTAQDLDWYNRVTELIKLYERSFKGNI